MGSNEKEQARGNMDHSFPPYHASPLPSTHVSSLLFLPLKVSEFMVVLTRHLLRVHGPLLRRVVILVEVTRVGRMPEFGDDGPFDLAIVECLPVDRGEERVGFDTVNTASEVAEALGWVY